MDNLSTHDTTPSVDEGVAPPERPAIDERPVFDPKSLPPAKAVAGVATAADSFDPDRAKAASADIESGKIEALSEQLSAGGKDLQQALRLESNSRSSLYRGLAHIHQAAQAIARSPEVLIALVTARQLKTTRASWKNPLLVLIKLACPKLNDKTASLYARAVNYIAASRVPDSEVVRFLTEHGVVALATEEARRQRLRRTVKKKEPREDPVEVFCRSRRPVPMPPSLQPDALGVSGKLALMIVGKHEGRFVAWGVDTDEKRTLAAVRQVAKRGQAKGWPATEVESNEAG